MLRDLSGTSVKISTGATGKNMLLSVDKFQLPRYGGSKEINTSTEYRKQADMAISRQKNIIYAGVIMSDNFTVSEHNRAAVTSSKEVGWIFRTCKEKRKKPK